MAAYEAAYCYFRDQLIRPVLNVDLPDPILTFSRGKKDAHAFFAPNAWRADLNQEERRCELALVPEHTADDPQHVMSCLVHEMAHFAEYTTGDAPKSPGYHGRKWFLAMEQLGLPAEQVSPKSRVAVVHRIAPNGPYAKAYDKLPHSILLPFVSALQEAATCNDESESKSNEAKTPESKSGKRCKYLCRQCETTMRGPYGRKLICGDCGMPYVAEESTPPENIITSEKDAASAEIAA